MFYLCYSFAGSLLAFAMAHLHVMGILHHSLVVMSELVYLAPSQLQLNYFCIKDAVSVVQPLFTKIKI